MICPSGHVAAHFTVPHPRTGEPADLHRCDPCKRELTHGRDGVGRWLRRAGFCDGCDAPTWRFLTHPTCGHDLLLWPKPTTRFPLFATPDGPGETIYRDFCPACCPALGMTAARVIAEIDGQPIAVAACVGFHPGPRARYAPLFSERYGEFLRAWLVDHLALSDADVETWIERWNHDRTEAIAAVLTETPHG